MCRGCSLSYVSFFFFFNDTATTEIYTLSLHDALPIWQVRVRPKTGWEALTDTERRIAAMVAAGRSNPDIAAELFLSRRDRKSTRLNSSHANISYAVFCLKKKKTREYKSVVSYTADDNI